MSNLVTRLSEGDHPVEVCIRPEKTVQALRQCLDRGYVHIKFTDTRGGTELGVRLDRNMTDLNSADFENETGTVRVTGGLTLDYVKVRCIADIALPSLAGTGRLEIVSQ